MKQNKLWDKGYNIDQRIEKFTVGKDGMFDLLLAKHDALGSISHAIMLENVGIISQEEKDLILQGLKAVLKKIQMGTFVIEEGVEDVHSQIELDLKKNIGQAAGKLHTARSRNDQVLLDLKLFYREQIEQLIDQLCLLSEKFLLKARIHKDDLMPGYTHTQVAMTSSFGMWFMAFAESFLQDAQLLSDIFPSINHCPLGSAAGYGSSFPIDRQLTSDLLGFEGLHINPINAQYNRGKSELLVSQVLGHIGLTFNKVSNDFILYSNENYRFVKLPKEFTTGSSIMPHKKNPDVFEIMRGHSNALLTLQVNISHSINNLTTGYHRDFQLLKEYLFPAFEKVKEMIDLLSYTLEKIEVNPKAIEEEKYQYIQSVEAVNELVLKGKSFRDAYKEVGILIENDGYEPPGKLSHSHIGSISNPGFDELENLINHCKMNNPGRKLNEILSKLLIY